MSALKPPECLIVSRQVVADRSAEALATMDDAQEDVLPT